MRSFKYTPPEPLKPLNQPSKLSKDVFIQEGVREHFNIPKIHQMIHYAAAIQSRGSADGYNREASERLHIDYAKEGYRASNKKDYIKQMTVWLGRQEAVAQFRAYLVYAKHSSSHSDSDSDVGFNSELEGEHQGIDSDSP